MGGATAELTNIANGCAAAGDTLAVKICRDAVAEIERLEAVVHALERHIARLERIES